MRKLVKILHTLAACGMLGGLACYMALLASASAEIPAAYAEARGAITIVSRFVVVPSMALALMTGLLAMISHAPFRDKGWVWIKALLGVSLFEGTLVAIEGRAREAEAFARRAAEGDAGALVTAAVGSEWGALAVITALSAAQVVVGVWRPRVLRSTASA